MHKLSGKRQNAKSAKNVLRHVLHTSLPVFSGNTIPPYPPVPLTLPSFSESPRGLLEAQNILPASSISCFCPSPLAYSTGKGVLQHRPLFFCGSSPLAMLAVGRHICACVHPEKPTTVWCDYHIWHVPPPLISLLWTPSPRSPMEFPLSCSPGHWFLSIPTKIRFSLYLFYS